MGAPSFLSEAPQDPVEFEVGGWRWETPEDDEDSRERVRVIETFTARRDVSYGLLLQEIEAADGGQGSLLAIFDRVLTDGDDTPPDEDGALSKEAQRFRDFVGSEDVYVSQKALIAAARWIAGEQADRPTGSPSGSRSTRRAGGRGSAGKRR